MRTTILACCAVLGVGWAVSCSTSTDGTGDGGNGGDSGGSGGSDSGGKGGAGSGGRGGAGSGGAASGGSNSGGAGSGGSNSGGGSGGAAAGGSGGTVSECSTKPEAKKVTFEAVGDVWEIHPDGRVNSSTPPELSSTQKRGASGTSLALTVNTADGFVPSSDAGTDATSDAAAASEIKRDWFYSFKNVATFAQYLGIGRKFSAWVFIPVGHKLAQAQLVYTSPNAFAPSTDNWKGANVLASAVPGEWSKVELTMPAEFKCKGATSVGWHELGLYFQTLPGETWSGVIFVDDFEFEAKP